MKQNLIAACLLMAATVASAAIPNDPVSCQTLGRYVKDIAVERDTGVTLQQAMDYTNELLEHAIGQEGSIVQTQADADYVRNAVKALWGESKNDPPPLAGINAMLKCMGK